MKTRVDDITADITAADFSNDKAAYDFAARMCADYHVRDVCAYEDFLPRWSFDNPDDARRFARTWKQIIREAKSLVVQAHTLGLGAIKNRLVHGANGTMLPHPFAERRTSGAFATADGSPAGGFIRHGAREDIPAGHTLYFTAAEKRRRLETAATAPQSRRFRNEQPPPRMRPNATRGRFAANGAAGGIRRTAAAI